MEQCLFCVLLLFGSLVLEIGIKTDRLRSADPCFFKQHREKRNVTFRVSDSLDRAIRTTVSCMADYP